MNVHEYGNRIRLNANEDISTGLNTMTIISPIRPVTPFVRTVDNGLIIPNVNFLTEFDGLYLANNYAEYRFKEGEINQIGLWSARLRTVTFDGENCKISDEIVTFEVKP